MNEAAAFEFVGWGTETFMDLVSINLFLSFFAPKLVCYSGKLVMINAYTLVWNGWMEKWRVSVLDFLTRKEYKSFKSISLCNKVKHQISSKVKSSIIYSSLGSEPHRTLATGFYIIGK